MSFAACLDQDEAPYWSNVYFNSLKVKNAIVFPVITPETQRNFYVSGSGSDSNTGLTIGSPLLTIKKAIEVASSYSGSECIINISGTVGIGSSAAPLNSGFDKVLDFSPLAQNYQLISVLGTRSDELSFAAGVAGTSAASPWDRWSTLTGLTGLVSSAYTEGIIHKKDGSEQDGYFICTANGTTSATVASSVGNQIAADGFEIYNVGSSVFSESSKYYVQSPIPLVFRDMEILGSANDQHYGAFLGTSFFYGCKFTSQAPQGMLLLEDGYVNGCACVASSYNDSVFRRDSILDISSVNFIGVDENFSVLGKNWTDIHGVDCSIGFSSCQGQIDRMLLSCDGVVNDVGALVMNNCQINLLSTALLLDNGNTSTLYAVKSDIGCFNGFSSQKTTGGVGEAVRLEGGCNLKIRGNCTLSCVNSNALKALQGSRFELEPSQEASPSNIFTSTSSYAIDLIGNCMCTLGSQATKDVYIVSSGNDEAVRITDCSNFVVNAIVANGPNFSSPATKAMIVNRYGSKVLLGAAGYTNSGAGTNNVLNGITATAVATSGCAQDIDLGASTAIVTNAQHCHVIVK